MRKLIKIIAVVLLFLLGNAVLNQVRIIEKNYTVTSDKVSQEYTFVQITDYHSVTKQNDKILSITKGANPDYILLTGDILQAEDIEPTLEFIAKLTEIAPVVYARGNHENDYRNYKQFAEELKQLKVNVVGQQSLEIGELNFVGIEDISHTELVTIADTTNRERDDVYGDLIASHRPLINDQKYNVLLAHRPKYLDAYASIEADLVVSGHAHGGQWRLPYTSIGAANPDGGILPTYIAGHFQEGETDQIVGTGTSNQFEPFIPRFFNPKEVVVIELKPQA